MQYDLARQMGGKRSPRRSPPLSVELQVGSNDLRKFEKIRLKHAVLQGIARAKPVSVDVRASKVTIPYEADIQGYMWFIGGRPPDKPRRLSLLKPNSLVRYTLNVDGVPFYSCTDIVDAMSLCEGFNSVGRPATVTIH